MTIRKFRDFSVGDYFGETAILDDEKNSDGDVPRRGAT